MCLLRWKYKDEKGKASRLEVVDEFRSFVKPVWRPQLSSFCTTLTGITQVCINISVDSLMNLNPERTMAFTRRTTWTPPHTLPHSSIRPSATFLPEMV